MDWDAATYDRVSGPQARWGSAVLGRLVIKGDETVLDAGCGSGRVTQQLLALLPRGRVLALDSSPAMIDHARSRLSAHEAVGRVVFVQADLLDLVPSVLGGAAPVDAVFSTATFHWVTDHDRLFTNLRSVLRPGGQLVAQCGGPGNIANVMEAVSSLGVKSMVTRLYATPAETRARLERAGFRDIDTWCNPEEATFEDASELVDFLSTVCLREQLASMSPDDRRPFAERVAAAMDKPAIDYVRLNIIARAA